MVRSGGRVSEEKGSWAILGRHSACLGPRTWRGYDGLDRFGRFHPKCSGMPGVVMQAAFDPEQLAVRGRWKFPTRGGAESRPFQNTTNSPPFQRGIFRDNFGCPVGRSVGLRSEIGATSSNGAGFSRSAKFTYDALIGTCG